MARVSPGELQDAVAHLAEIQRQMIATETFRGYRAATIAATSVLAVTGAIVQALWCPDPMTQPLRYLGLWVSIAVASLVTSTAQVLWQGWTSASSHRQQQTRIALEQFLPCTFLGGGVTWAVTDWDPSAMWLLPGLWSGLFGLGVLASSRQLPRPVAWVGLYYLCMAVGPLAVGPGRWACAPWWMALSFGVGQAAVAAILYAYLERDEASSMTKFRDDFANGELSHGEV